MTTIYHVIHDELFSEDEVVSVHASSMGAALMAQQYAVRIHREQARPYGTDLGVQWDSDGKPYWEWEDNKVYIKEEELRP